MIDWTKALEEMNAEVIAAFHEAAGELPVAAVIASPFDHGEGGTPYGGYRPVVELAFSVRKVKELLLQAAQVMGTRKRLHVHKAAAKPVPGKRLVYLSNYGPELFTETSGEHNVRPAGAAVVKVIEQGTAVWMDSAEEADLHKRIEDDKCQQSSRRATA